MSGPIENVANQILSGVATISGDSNRRTAPYYRYGQKWFQTQEGKPPQVRIQVGQASLSAPLVRGGTTTYDSTVNLSGSIGTINQDLEFTIWGNDEAEVLQEFNYLCQGINLIKANNPENVGQPGLQENLSNISWVDTSARDIKGEMISFTYPVNINIPERSTQTKVISSSLNYVSQSSAWLSSSYEGSKHFLLTSSV
jgi:hypothetical protein